MEAIFWKLYFNILKLYDYIWLNQCNNLKSEKKNLPEQVSIGINNSMFSDCSAKI